MKDFHDAANTSNVLTGTVAAEGNLVLKVYYTRNSYTVTFKNHDNTVLLTETKKFGEAIVAPTTPAKAEYIFAGWTPTLAATMPSRDMEYKATFRLAPVNPAPTPNPGRTCQDDGYPKGYEWNGTACVLKTGYKVPNTGVK